MTRKPAAIVFVLSLAVLALVVLPAAGLAAKGGNAGSQGGGGGGKGGGGKPGGAGGTIELVLLESTDGLAHYGQKVTFSVSTTATDYPWVVAKCYQNGTLVYEQANGIFPTSLGQNFTLGPTPAWSGGAANCTAYLQDWSNYSRGKVVTLASMDFDVYA